MRPIRLTLQGFKSHEGHTEFDFSERTLFAIVGPMGAGKTTILDGVSFALYAKTPKVQRTTKSLICSTKDAADIEFIFEAEGRTYTINRSIRNKGTAVHTLVDDAGERISGEAAVTSAVEDILRLDFHAFRSSVLLAQNQFDEFFKATPDTRMRILKGVFRFDQLDAMRDRARDHRNEFQRQASELEGGLKVLPEDVDEQISAAKTEIETIETRLKALEKVGPAEQKLLTKRDRAGEELQKAGSDLAEAIDLAADLPTAEAMDNLVGVEEQIAAPLEKAKKRVAEVKVAHKKARTALTELEASLGKETALVALLGTAQRFEEIQREMDASKTVIKQAQTALVAAEKAVATAAANEKKAVTALEALEQERKALHDADHAHALRVGMKPGDPCPVCDQVVKSVPKKKGPAGLDTIEDRIADAKTALTSATNLARDASEELVGAKHEAKSAQQAATSLEPQIEKIEAELSAALGHTKDSVSKVKERKDKVTDAREGFERLDEDLTEAQEELDKLQDEAETFTELREQLVEDLAHVASALKQPRLDRKAPSKELAATATALRELLDERIEAGNARVADLEKAKDSVETEIQKLYENADLEAGQTLASSIAQLQERRGNLGARIERFEADIKRSKKLRAELAEKNKQSDIYDTLYDDLANTKFIDYLLEDKRRLLSELASAQLLQMTGRYRFSSDGSFDVVDEFNADKKRGVGSLSGGETFLASLALALGLAESVTRHGGRLQCFFLDEGFGSLDADALQKAMDGIERIATQNRLIGLVSHTQGVAERVIDKIELDRDDNGMTIVKEAPGAGLRLV